MRCKKGRHMVRRILPAAILLLSVCAFTITGLAGVDPDEVIVGKNGWLFYDSEDSVADYQGTDLFNDIQLRNIRRNLKAMKDYFEEKDVPFIIFLIPNKERVYAEYMPDEYGTVASYTRIEQLCDYLSDEFTILTPYQDLIAAKMLYPRYDFYYRTDAHWNSLGSYIGAQALMNAIGDPLPAFSRLTIVPRIIPGRELAEPLGLQDSFTDIEYTVSGYGPYKETVLASDGTDGDYAHYYTSGAPDKNMVIYGDSFSLGMAPYLGQSYRNIYVHRRNNKKSDAEVENPSVVVCELVERSLYYLQLIQLYN